MSMSKKDYIILAELISKMYQHINATVGATVDEDAEHAYLVDTIGEFEQNLMAELKAQNPRFNEEIFLTKIYEKIC